MWEYTTYFKDGKVLEYNVSWLHIELNQLQTEYDLLLNTEPN